MPKPLSKDLSLHHPTPLLDNNKQLFIEHLLHLIRHMPGFVAWKTINSVYAGANKLCAQLAGYKTIESFIGTNDYDWKCEAVEVADHLRNQDETVLKTKANWSSLNILKFSNGSITYYHSHKSILYDPSGEVLGILFMGTILNNTNLIKTLISLTENNALNKHKMLESHVYPIVGKDNGELKLSQRQSECLFYTLRGKRTKDIGSILGVSGRTVETYIEQIKIKFGCHSRSQLIEKAMNNGYFYHIPSSLVEKNIINIF